jgi:hypothetical protein
MSKNDITDATINDAKMMSEDNGLEP